MPRDAANLTPSHSNLVYLWKKVDSEQTAQLLLALELHDYGVVEPPADESITVRMTPV